MADAVTVIVRVVVADVAPSVAVSVIGYVPTVVGAPVICPVVVFRVRFAGRGVAGSMLNDLVPEVAVVEIV